MNKTKYLMLSLVLLVIILGAIPTKIILTFTSEDFSLDQGVEIDSLTGSNTVNEIPRLMKQPSIPNNPNFDHSSENNILNHNQPSFAIGSQEGVGGGNVMINDTFKWTGIENMTTQNALYSESSREKPISLITPSDYTKQNMYLNISDISAKPDLKLIEEDTEDQHWTSFTNGYYSVAMSFETDEDFAFLSEVLVYHGDLNSPNGIIYIVNETYSGDPEPNNTAKISSSKSLDDSGPGWYPYDFSSDNIILEKGQTYYVVMNTTFHDINNYWRWYNQFWATFNGDGGDVFYIHKDFLNIWNEESSRDIPLQIRITPMDEDSGSYIAKKYDSPSNIKIWYNTSTVTENEVLLSSFTNFPANNTNTHIFKTNTSVTFNLTFVANYTYSLNPFSAETFFKAQNNTDTFWNITFSTKDVNNTYNVKNRTISISGLQSDWNGWEIYWNDSSTPKYSDLEEDSAITYSNGSSTMNINMSDTWQNQTWNVSFNAPNYMYYFNISGIAYPIDLPYKANVTDTVNLNFNVDEAGGNTSYWIEYYGQYIHSRTNCSPLNDDFESWIINDNVSQTTNVNGTYDIQCFWINSAETKVGTVTRNLDVFINTTIDIKTETELLVENSVILDDNIEIIINDRLNITVLYNSTHNGSSVQNAEISCEANWTTNTNMNQLADKSYNASFDTSGQIAGNIGNLTIVTKVSWFVNWTKTIFVHFVDTSTLVVNTSATLYLEWKENTTLEIDYQNSSNNGINPGVSFDIDGVTINPTWDGGDEVYRFLFNSTDFSGINTYSMINISTVHDDYLDKTWTFDLVITPGITNITGTVNGSPHTNETDLATFTFSNSSLDSVTINLQYYHILTNENLTSDIPTFESLLPNTTNFIEQPDTSWTITFNPNQTGVFVINITFSQGNYTDALFMFNISVLNAPTQIQTDYIDNTTVFYAESYEFSVFYNNTYWNENITFNPVVGDNLTINDASKVQFLNRTSDLYWFEFNYDSGVVGVTYHSINITFESINYFDSSFIIVWFNVTKSPFVDVNGTEIVSSDELINSTSIYDRNYSPSDYDNLTLLFNYFANKTNQNLTVSSNEITLNMDPSITNTSIPQGFNNWLLIFDGSTLGTFTLQITFSHENYTSVLFEVYYTINPADTSFTDYSPEIENYPPFNGSVESGNTLEFWVVWQSQYSEAINDSNGVIVSTNGTSWIIFLSSNLANGTHYFRFTAGSTGIAEINLTFGTIQYNTLNLTLIIQINDRSLEVDAVLSSHPSGWVWDRADFLRYGDTFYFFVYIKDSQNSSSIDISDFTGNLPINVTFENVTNGYHLFSYEALYVGTTSALTIQFEKTNYGSALYTITFIIIQADSEVVLAPVSVNTYWTQDTNFSVIWQSIPFTQPNVTNQVLRINSSTISTNDTRVIFQSPSINGNYTFLIDASTVGIFTVRLNLQSSQFVNQIYELQIEILPVPTYFGGLTSPSNNSVIGELTPLYFSKTYNFTIQWFDTFNNSGIVDSVAIVSGSGMNYISTTYLTFTNGNHTFIYHANATGTFQIFIHLENSTFAESVFNISFIVTTMPTNALIPDNIDSDEPILVETTLYLNGSGYETFENDSILTLDVISLWMNGSSVPGANFDFLASNNQFWINFSTVDYQWGSYNLTIRLETTGYQIQSTSINITLQGREIRVTLDIPQGNIIWGDDVDITALLEYINAQTAGIGSSINLASLEGVDVSFRVIIEYKNGSTSTFEDDIQTDASHEATFTITGQNTQSAVRFTEISVLIASSFSGLPVSFSMLPNNFPPIQPPTFQQLIDLIFFLLPFLIVGLVIFTVSVTVYRYRRRKKVRILTESRVVEQSFEDIKSIRLILARHESGLQFYSESTIADLATDTDALSGMSAAISSFMEEVSGSMASRSGEVKTREIEMMSREGLHMLIWHGTHSSLIIISEVRLPDYFQERLKKLGNTLEKKYEAELLNFYSSDQIPSSVVKKMVRNFIPLHYFSAFILNEGVLTLESIKLSGKERKMLKYMKEIQFVKEGIQFFFSEQIISQLSKKWKRSEAIKFLNKSIDLNLLIEASQEDLLDLQK